MEDEELVRHFSFENFFDDNFAFKHTAVSPLEFKDKDEKLLYKIQLAEFAHSLRKYGAMIDMLIDRADRVLNLCEMKFTRDEFSIDKDYDTKLRTKIETLTRATKNRKNIQATLVTTYGRKLNMYSSRIQRVVVMDALFR